jgi:flagellar biosynthesis activator protein FlaF
MQQQGAEAYQKVARQTASPRDLEANLLSRAAARFQRIKDDWDQGRDDLFLALQFNRRLWSIFLSSVTRSDSILPPELRHNVANLGIFVMKHSLAVQVDPAAQKLDVLININRNLAAGLRASPGPGL